MVEVAQGDYVLVPALAEIALAHSSDTDRGDSQLVARRLIAGTSEDKTGHNYRHGETGSKHGASGYFMSRVVSGIFRLVGTDCFIR